MLITDVFLFLQALRYKLKNLIITGSQGVVDDSAFTLWVWQGLKSYWNENGWKVGQEDDEGADAATPSDGDDETRERIRRKRVAESGTWMPTAEDFLDN